MENPPLNNPPTDSSNNGGGDNYHLTLDQLIFAANLAINNANHPEIEPLLQKRGISSDDIANAKKLVENVQTLEQKQKKEYAEQYQATETFNQDWKRLKEIYGEHVELARIAFEDNVQNYFQLGLQGSRKSSFSGFMQQASQFYKNAVKDDGVMDALGKKGISKKEFEETLEFMEKVEDEKNKQSKETGEARQATKDRDAAQDELGKWFGTFKRTATVALASKPTLLRILGF